MPTAVYRPVPFRVQRARQRPPVVAAPATSGTATFGGVARLSSTGIPARSAVAVGRATAWLIGVSTLQLPFRDDFTSVIDAMWTELDTDGVLAPANGRAFFEYPPTTDAWGNPGLVSKPISRSSLGAFAGLVRLTNRIDIGKGFRVALSPSASDSVAAGAGYIAHLYPDLFATAGDESVSTVRQRSKDLLWSVVKRENGGWILCVSEGASGGEWPVFPDAAIVSVTGTEADSTVYAHLADRKGRVAVDYAAILAAADRPTALTTRFGAALASEASGTRAAGTSSITDCGTPPRVIEAMMSRGANNDTRAVICFRGSDSTYANAWQFKGEFDRFSLHKPGAGMQTQSGAAVMAASTPTHLKVVDFGNRIDCYVNGVRRLTWSDTAGATNTFAGTACDTGASLSVSVTDFGAWKNVTLNNNFGPFPAVRGQVGASSYTDTFTDTDGTLLPSHNAAWTNNLSTFEVNTNKARITAAATRGIATVQVLGPNHGAKAKVGVPADPGAYPTDVYAGIVIRYTDNSNFLYARIIWQDGPSPEVEILEVVAGSGNMIAYVNMTGTIVSATEYTLEFGGYGAEVVARLNGEVVAQGTTAVLTGTGVGLIAWDENAGNVAGRPTWDDFEAFLTQPSYTATWRGEARAQTTGASARSAAVVERAIARLQGTGVKGGLAQVVTSALARLQDTALKGGVGSATVRGSVPLSGGVGLKASSGAATERGEGSLSATGATARSAQALLRAAGRLTTAAGGVLSQPVAFWASARFTATGLKASTSNALERGSGVLTTTGLKAAINQAAIRARGFATAGSTPLLQQPIAIWGRAWLSAVGTKSSAGSANVAVFGRIGALAAKLGQGTATYAGRPRWATTAARVGVGGALWRGVGALGASAVKRGAGTGVFRALAKLASPRGVDPTVKGPRAVVVSLGAVGRVIRRYTRGKVV